jgi:hypothetical protein
MASDHAYTALAAIENFTGIDWSAVDSVAFSDARVDATISLAETIINGYLGQSSILTVTDGITTSAILITAKLLHDKAKVLGYQLEGYTSSDVVQLSVPEILKMFLHETEDAFVDSIPMSGANATLNPDKRTY